MSSSSQAKVLIVGAGPVGLVLALALLKNDIPVRIIEKSVHPRIGQRGAGLMPRSLEVFESLGILDEVLSRSIPLPPIRMYKLPGGTEILKEFRMAPVLEPTPAIPHINLRSLGQDHLNSLLRKRLDTHGCVVEFGVELKDLEQFPDNVQVKLVKKNVRGEVEAQMEERYDWVMGTDGAKGTVRKLLKMNFLGETSVEHFVIGDIKIEGLSPDVWHIWEGASTLVVSLRPTEDYGVFNFIMTGAKFVDYPDAGTNEDALRRAMSDSTGNREDLRFGEVICMAPYIPNIRMVDDFGKGRVYIAGDAAHVHSPMGGQGLNTGIMDSFNIGWKLALVVKGLASPSLLDTYSEERIPVVAKMLNLTTAILKKTVNETTDEKVWERGGNLNQLGVNCRWSSIVLDEFKHSDCEEDLKTESSYDADGSVRAGDRAPDVPGLVKLGDQVKERLFDLLSPTRHTVMVFSDADYKPVLESLARYPVDLVHPIIVTRHGSVIDGSGCTVFEDVEGHAYEAYKTVEGKPLGVVVIRPDGVVGSVAKGREWVEKYFQSIFS